jgi:hypothetical protein
MANRVILLFLILLCAIGIAGCFPGAGHSSQANPAGFFTGVWHGWIAPISLILGLFDDKVRLYELTNTGWWYDLGFYIAVISGFGGIAFTRGKKKKES